MLLRTPLRLVPSVAVRAFHRTSGPAQIAKFFDNPKYFANFNLRLVFSPTEGLFRNHHLTSPHGLVSFLAQSLDRAKALVKTMLVDARNTDQGKLTYIRRLDQLSDLLCRVIDVAEFIRVVHPSQRWADAAQQTHELMFEYMNQLNTDTELYTMLCLVLELEHVTRHLSDEELEVGRYLRQDFERSGIAMDPTTRANFVSITQKISLLGAEYNNNMHTLDLMWVLVPQAVFDTLDRWLAAEIKHYQRRAPRKAGHVHIPLAGDLPARILASCDCEEVRKTVWIALHNSLALQVDTLNDFVRARALLAAMLGYRSFSDYQLEHKMAKLPEHVSAFLHNLQESLVAKVAAESRPLYELKQRILASADRQAGTALPQAHASDDTVLTSLKPWDKDFLVRHQNRSMPDDISEYLSVGTIMSGLDQLFRSVYNVALIPEKTAKGEAWDTQVRKLSYVDLASSETLGYLYVDFWLPKVLPSHFTIVCLRELNTQLGTEPLTLDKEVALSTSKEYQLPVISLVCNFDSPAGDDTPTLLTLEQVDTIFHEMGHATHLMLGRTRLHNLSGTRCLTDFVELPSVLMELFSSDPRVMCKIARHYKTGEPLPEDLFLAHRALHGGLKYTETYMQLKMALLDQALHDESVFQAEVFDSTKVYHELEHQMKVYADEWSTWHGKFPHLFSYGAVYYLYLLDRAIAQKIWKGLFEADPWSRDAGEKYRQSVLKWGGTRDPWVCLADALDEPVLAKGDAQAMAIIGEM